MMNRILPAVVALGGAVLMLAGRLPAEQTPPATPGVEVLAQGPIHEAFAEPIEVQAQEGPMIPKEPPAAINEVPPDQKPSGDNVDWIPGYWQWDDQRNDFVWVSGVWRNPPPGRKWVPGHYAQMGEKYEWVSGFWAPANQQQVPYQPAPPATVEAGPSMPAPTDNSVYNPGTWLYQDSKYAWQPGSYLDSRPGWVWVPAHYVWTPAGYVFVDGYWDYAPDQRGLLFAPAVFDQSLCYQPGFAYTPNYVCPFNILPTALFVRPGWGHYFYGDYFGANYRRAGFVPFFEYSYGRGGVFDPLFNYYRRAYAGQPWERNLRALYAGRAGGTIAAPPRTLAQQGALVRNLNGRGLSTRNVTMVAPLTPTTSHGVALTRLNAQQLAAARQSAQAVRTLSNQRRTRESGTVKNRTPVAAPAHAAVRTEVSPGVHRVERPAMHYETPFQRRETAPAVTHPQIVRGGTPELAKHAPAVVHHEAAKPAAHPAAPAAAHRATPRPPTHAAPAKRSAAPAHRPAHSGRKR